MAEASCSSSADANGETSSTEKRTMSPTSFLNQLGYKLGKTVGEGSYAKVKLAECRSSGKKVAVKVISRKKAPRDFVEKFLPRELHVVLRINHDNLVRIHNVYEYCDIVFIVMEYAEGGDLLDFIKTNGAVPEPKAKRMFKELCNAIRYCHSMHICHRDLKCENLLLDKDHHIKVSDFGFARYCIDVDTGKRILSKTYCGSAAYAAPEVLQGTPYNPKMYDVWSLGCILYIMICGSMPYDDSNVKKMLKTQLDGKVGFPARVIDKLSRESKQLVHHMLEVDVTRRATLDQVLKSDWFTKGDTSSTRP